MVETWFHRIMSVNKSTFSPEAQRTRSCPGPSLWGEQDWLVLLRLRTSKHRDIQCHSASLITQHELSITGHTDGTYFGMLPYSIYFNFSYGHHRYLWQLLIVVGTLLFVLQTVHGHKTYSDAFDL